ncbi:MAG: hypothetical protein FD133_229 [Erysipelotrichaceae bacterium]|nr:MAG: hypothetical protein FD133_229 [Erysipelotrichaceae bacterium]
MVNLFKPRLQIEYLRFLLKRNARYMLIMSIAMLTLYPVLAITVNILSRSSGYDGIRETGMFFNIGLLLLTSFMIPLQIMNYMNSKKNLDVYHALPIKRSDLLLTSLIAAILIVIVPFTVGWFSGGILTLTSEIDFLVILERYVALIGISTAILSIVLFTMMNTGTSLDAFLYSVVLNFLPILAYGAYILFVQTILLCFSIGNLTKVIGIIFPIYALFESGFEASTRMWMSGYVNGLYWLIVASVIIIISNQFYLIRKSEKAEKPFTNKTFFPTVSGLLIILFIIFLYCVIYSLNSMAYYTSYYAPINFFFPIFFSMVLYLVMDAIAERGFKHLFRAFLNYLIIAAVAFALLIGGLATKGFGYASKIPSLANIESVDVIFTDYTDLIIPSPDNSTDFGRDVEHLLKFTSDSDIKAVYDLHKIIISEFKWIDYNYGFSDSSNLIEMIEDQPGYQKSYVPLSFLSNKYNASINLTITYHLKGGSTQKREYVVPIQWTGVLLTLNNSPEIIKLTAPNLSDIEIYPVLKVAKWSSILYGSSVNVSALSLQALKTAYLEDLASLSDAQIISTEYKALGYLSMETCKDASETRASCLNSSLDVDTRFTRVVGLLESTGLVLNPTPDSTYVWPKAALLLPNESTNPLVKDSALFKIAMSGSSMKSVQEMFYYNYEVSTPIPVTYVELTNDQLVAILPYVSQKGISDVPLMSLALQNGYGNLLVQAQYTDEVLAIIAGNQRKTSTEIYTIFDAMIKN